LSLFQDTQNRIDPAFSSITTPSIYVLNSFTINSSDDRVTRPISENYDTIVFNIIDVSKG